MTQGELPANSYDQVAARELILNTEQRLKEAIENGTAESRVDACPVTHYFTAMDKRYGCHVYARQMFIPKGVFIIGKIHKQEHLAFILKGKISVATEFGKKYFEAPCILISEAGVKRIGYAEEDTIWATCHLTAHAGEENLEKIEDEVIAKSYDELGLIDRIEKLHLEDSK